MAKSTGRVGRPTIEFDLEIVEGLGRIGATAAEMAYVLPAARTTIEHRMADQSSDFHKAYRKGQSLLKASLRRKQIAVAMSGNVVMLIWLGKQHLAQQDRVTIDAEEGREYIRRLGNAGDAAKEAGDEAGEIAADDALRRIGDGERPEVVYLEWLRVHGARGGEG
jgi:hypothetical protein